jgi:hypothetical protein
MLRSLAPSSLQEACPDLVNESTFPFLVLEIEGCAVVRRKL